MGSYIVMDKWSTEESLNLVDDYIEHYAAPPAGNSEIGKIIRYAASSRGKMLRPRLLILAGMYGPEYENRHEKLCRLGALLELIHMSSLIHDDIIDDAPLRRGKETVQAKFGKDVAVYTGDFLLARVLCGLAKEERDGREAEYAEAIETVCLGEIEQDISRFSSDMSIERYLAIIRGKTATLFKLAAGAGATATKCDKEIIDRLENIGELLGMLFQARDDLLDYIGDEKLAGKAVQTDFKQGIYTMPLLFALEDHETAEKLRKMLEENKKCQSNTVTEKAISLVRKSCGIERTKALMQSYIGKIREMISELPRNPAGNKILAIVEGLADV